MASLNKVMLIGNLGGDPEMRYTQNQTPVVNFNLATTEKYNDKQETTWHRIVVWGKQAENCSKYLTKGKSVFIEGRITVRNWEDKEGVKRTSTDITAHTVVFLSPKTAGDAHPAEYGNGAESHGGNHGIDDIPF